MSTFTRKAPKERKAEILHAALHVAESTGFATFTRADVATQAGVSPASVSKYFSTMLKLRREVMRAAVHTERLNVIAQGLVLGDKQAHRVTPELRERALASVN